ncbi:hypothetical protein ACFL1A_00245 [Patescibacteria group bacterium]
MTEENKEPTSIEPESDKLAPPKKSNIPLLIFGVVAFVLTFTAFFISNKIQEKTSLRSKAGANQATISLQPSSTTLPPNSSVQLWLTVDDPVGFVHAEFTFDPAKVKLTQDPEIASDNPLRTVITNTSKSSANSNGNMKIVTALHYDDRDNPPIGTFQLANFIFEPNTSEPNVSTELVFSLDKIQIFNMDSGLFNVQAENVVFNVNPQATSPTATPTTDPAAPTATITPTLAAIPGDLNNSSHVDIYDYNIMVENFGRTGEPGFHPTDINRNGEVDIFDYNILVENFGR